MRGEQSVRIFANEMLSTLNMPKNAGKSHWSGMSLEGLAEKLTEEFLEVLAEMDKVDQGDNQSAANLMLECADLANVAMMLRDHAEKILITISHDVK